MLLQKLYGQIVGTWVVVEYLGDMQCLLIKEQEE